jgi:chemotaxis protein CheX
LPLCAKKAPLSFAIFVIDVGTNISWEASSQSRLRGRFDTLSAEAGGFFMDVKFINPFLKGTLEVLKKMAFIEPLPGKPYLKQTSLAGGDVSGIIGITGDAIGSLAISFTEPCICDICSRMLGESYSEANQDVFDAVGEITNMISGVARTYLEKDGMSVYAAIPFSTDMGSLLVDVCIKKTAAKARLAENYSVVNVKTAVAGEAGRESPAARLVEAVAAVETDPKVLLKKKLKDISVIRDDMVRQLAEKPFMEIGKRQMLKKKIPFLDAQIKRLKLDLSAMDVLSKITQDALDNPKIVKHYQHYEDKKRGV